MDISAETLYRKSNIGAINHEIEEIYKAIKVKISLAHQMGHSGTSFELPDNFSVGNMEPADCQLIIYSKLIEKVEQQGLSVKLAMDQKKGSSLEISWPSHLDPAEKARMRKIILSHLKQPDAKK
jgi:hypothetical protein